MMLHEIFMASLITREVIKLQLLLGLSKENARVEIMASLFYFVQLQVAAKSDKSAQTLCTIRLKRIQKYSHSVNRKLE